MNLNATEDSASRFAVYLGELTSVIGHADREQPLNDYCAGLMVAEGRRSVEPIAAMTAPKEVAAQHQRLLHFVAAVVRYGSDGQSAPADLAGDRAAWTDRSLDYRRYVFSKVRHQIGRRAASVLRAAWQASQLSGGRDIVGCQSSCQPAHRVPALSAAGMGQRRKTSQESAYSQGDLVQDQTRDRAGTDRGGVGCGRTARNGDHRCELWVELIVPRRRHCPRT